MKTYNPPTGPKDPPRGAREITAERIQAVAFWRQGWWRLLQQERRRELNGHRLLVVEIRHLAAVHRRYFGI